MIRYRLQSYDLSVKYTQSQMHNYSSETNIAPLFKPLNYIYNKKTSALIKVVKDKY